MFFGFFISLKKITRQFFNFKINIIFFKYLLFTNILLCPNETVKKKKVKKKKHGVTYIPNLSDDDKCHITDAVATSKLPIM